MLSQGTAEIWPKIVVASTRTTIEDESVSIRKRKRPRGSRENQTGDPDYDFCSPKKRRWSKKVSTVAQDLEISTLSVAGKLGNLQDRLLLTMEIFLVRKEVMHESEPLSPEKLKMMELSIELVDCHYTCSIRLNILI